MNVACCIPKPTNKFSEYVIFIAFPLQQWLHERTSVIDYTYIVCLVKFKTSLLSAILVCKHICYRIYLLTFYEQAV
jgi:hypothetical protein